MNSPKQGRTAPTGTPPPAGDSTKTNSPFRYPGGKYRARRLILDEAPPHHDYCEPFAGGASVFFAKPACPGVTVLNDLDSDVINTLRQIRDRVDDLIGLLQGVAATKAEHAYYKTAYEPTNNLERAFRWYYLNRTSYSGITRPENCYWGYHPQHSKPPERWPPHLRTVSAKLQNTVLSSLDFEPVIDRLPNGCFVLVDPPYFGAAQHKIYNVTFDPGDHQRLAACLQRNTNRVRFLLTYDDHPHVREMYS